MDNGKTVKLQLGKMNNMDDNGRLQNSFTKEFGYGKS